MHSVKPVPKLLHLAQRRQINAETHTRSRRSVLCALSILWQEKGVRLTVHSTKLFVEVKPPQLSGKARAPSFPRILPSESDSHIWKARYRAVRNCLLPSRAEYFCPSNFVALSIKSARFKASRESAGLAAKEKANRRTNFTVVRQRNP